ncbi:MAG: TolC family protein [Acidobacteria bacterium]|nr:TolC family protein [Acidobacteriota bacterium]
MKNPGAKFIRWMVLVLAVGLPPGIAAQTPRPIQPTQPTQSTPSGGPSIPRNLTLQQAEQLLLQRNLTVLAAKYQVEANRAARLLASFKPNPTLTLGAEQFNLSGRLFKDIARTDPNSAAATTYTIRYDQLIERGGKRELRTELADAQLKASEAQMLDAARTQLYQLRQAFTTAALARENLLLAESTKQQYDQTIRLTATKVENGDLAGVELYRVQASALQYQQAVQQARTAYQQASRDILNLLGARAEDVQGAQQVADAATGAKIINASFAQGVPGTGDSNAPGDEPLQIEFKFNDRPLTQAPIELREIALAERPDVIAARRLYDAARKGVSLAEAQRVRDVSAGTFMQRVGSDQTVGVNVSIPLFIHNKGFAAISQAESQKEAAAALVRQAELQAVTDVEKAYLAYQSARRTLDLYNSTTLERAGKLKAIAAISYKEGASSLIELLDAERTYNQTVNSYNQARADYQMALWQLEQATGRPLH